MRTATTTKAAGRLLPKLEFRDRPWRIHEIAGDFDLPTRVEDVAS